ncbi:S-adenosylmethionine-dependent methyltransferase Rv2258c-like [Asterias amurensis]|uniref:S-adenosylmethionine-dependent methyltransferase Rv2258c-like n=1 Tax=Asterias amurensis TaxID=7602 RepID=UPI003AB733F9
MTDLNASNNVETQKEFTLRLANIVGDGLLCVSIAMGIETGLFQTMIDLKEEHKTTQEIADAGDFKERYVREWLGSQVAAKIVEYDPKDGTYWLPLQRYVVAGTVKASAMTRAIPNLCAAFFDVAKCFKKDGPRGVSYDKYAHFDELMAGMNQEFFNDCLIQSFLPSMPKLHQQLQDGIKVLEIGCSQGMSTRIIAQNFPNSQVYGIDITESGIKEAQEKATEAGLGNVHFIFMSATVLPSDWSETFDYVFVHNVLHDLPYPMKSLHEIMRVLKKGGTLSVIDTATYSKLEDNVAKIPTFARNCYVLSMMNCVPTSLNNVDGAGLGAMWGREKAQEMMKAANFDIISISSIPKSTSLHYQCQKM